MSDPREKPDLSHITPGQFAALVAGADDELILETVRETGTEATLDRIFEGMRDRFRPEQAPGVDARIHFVVADQGREHSYLVAIRDGACSVDRERVGDAKVTLATDLLSFVKLTAGKVGGPQLFMAGKLKISGDLMFATRIMGFFEVPKPE
jgi:putative sterol carrier protein